jgi:hypothetical protein
VRKAVVRQNSPQRNMVTVSSVLGEVIGYNIQHLKHFPYVACVRKSAECYMMVPERQVRAVDLILIGSD